jgi:D-serine deaminase-like pyridoxal phosphate-dependent protein
MRARPTPSTRSIRPALIVDLDRLEANIARWAAFAREAGVRLRPHGKTHKCVEIAQRQLPAGAVGLTLAKIGEAEVMAQSGVSDIFLAYEVIGGPKLPRLIDLARRIRVRVGVDSVECAEPLARAAAGGESRWMLCSRWTPAWDGAACFQGKAC